MEVNQATVKDTPQGRQYTLSFTQPKEEQSLATTTLEDTIQICDDDGCLPQAETAATTETQKTSLGDVAANTVKYLHDMGEHAIGITQTNLTALTLGQAASPAILGGNALRRVATTVGLGTLIGGAAIGTAAVALPAAGIGAAALTVTPLVLTTGLALGLVPAAASAAMLPIAAVGAAGAVAIGA
ncbi:MAG: hypothetical protein IJ133_04105, partial [Clostridia bacterium]|nr:hypothetical protein [Clostridia bacterium]